MTDGAIDPKLKFPAFERLGRDGKWNILGGRDPVISLPARPCGPPRMGFPATDLPAAARLLPPAAAQTSRPQMSGWARTVGSTAVFPYYVRACIRLMAGRVTCTTTISRALGADCMPSEGAGTFVLFSPRHLPHGDGVQCFKECPRALAIKLSSADSMHRKNRS